MWSRPSSAGSSPRLWALLWACLLLVFCAPTLTAQSTTSEQLRPDTKPKSVLVWPEDLLTLRSKIADLESNSKTLAERVATLQQQLDDSLTAQGMLSSSLTESSTKLESLTLATEARENLDQKALDDARGALMAWAGGGFLVGAALTAVTIFVFHSYEG